MNLKKNAFSDTISLCELSQGVHEKFFAIAVLDTGIFMIRANAPTNNYRIQDKKIRIRYEKGDFYGTDIWLIPK